MGPCSAPAWGVAMHAVQHCIWRRMPTHAARARARRLLCSVALPAGCQLGGPAAACSHACSVSWGTAGMQGIDGAWASMHPASDMERITLLCVTSMFVQGLQVVSLGAEVLLQGSSAFRQPDGKLCAAVAVAGACMERWQGRRAVDCCTCVAAGGVLRLMLACRELGGCLLRPPSLHCRDPAWVMMRHSNLPSQQEASLDHKHHQQCTLQGATWTGDSVLISSAYSTSSAGTRCSHLELVWALSVLQQTLQYSLGF